MNNKHHPRIIQIASAKSTVTGASLLIALDELDRLADQNDMPRLHSIAAQIDNACRQIIELLDELKEREVAS